MLTNYKKIKIYSLSYCDSGGGAATAFLRINYSLSKFHFINHLHVIEKRLRDPTIKVHGNYIDQIMRRVRFYITKIIFLNNIKQTKSINLINSGVANYINKKYYDIVNLHWIGCETISLGEIRKINKPIVWTLHDMWPISGIYHYNVDKKYFNKECKNIYKKNYFNFLDNITIKRKQALFKEKKIHLVSPSKWLLDEAKKTKLPFGKMEVIPYPINTNFFKKNKNIKALKFKYKIPDNKKILLYSSNVLNEKRKGSKIILEMIKNNFIKDNNYIIVMLGKNNNFIKDQFNPDLKLLGCINDYALIKEIYSVADVLLFPSIIDNFPNTILEAMSCSLPCVAFDCFGMKEMIHHKKDGYLAKPYLVNDFQRGIKYVLSNKEKLSLIANKKIISNFSYKTINLKYLNFFKKIISK